jgi:hypothetical protein
MKPTILIPLFAILVSCSSVSVKSGSDWVHVQNTFGQAAVAKVTTGTINVEGFQSDNTAITGKALDWWGWVQFWQSDAVKEVSQGVGSVLKDAGNAINN